MTRVKILKNEKKRVRRIVVEDHVMYADKGSDIVCAAISSLVFTFINSLERVLKLDKETYKIKIDKEKAIIRVDFDRESIEKDEELDLLIGFLMTGLLQIRNEYKDHIKILVKEEENV